MAETDEQAEAFEAEGRTQVVRLKMPREGKLRLRRPDPRRCASSTGPASRTTSFSGPTARACITWPASSMTTTFKISHVIRAEEHLSNTPRQIFIAQSLGYPLPEYAHLPYVAEPGSKNKLRSGRSHKYLKNPDSSGSTTTGPAIAARIGSRGDVGRDVQPGHRRFLRARSATCPTRSSTT